MPTPENTHLHFIVWAAMGQSGNSYTEVTYLDLIANDIDQAVSRAMEVCPGRRFYWVNNVIEHHGHGNGPQQESEHHGYTHS